MGKRTKGLDGKCTVHITPGRRATWIGGATMHVTLHLYPGERLTIEYHGGAEYLHTPFIVTALDDGLKIDGENMSLNYSPRKSTIRAETVYIELSKRPDIAAAL